MIKKYLVPFLLTAILFAVISMSPSCTKDQTPIAVVTPGECPDTIRFSTQIMPMIQSKCANCHSPTGGQTPFLTNHSEVSANATAILPTIRWDAGASRMPDNEPKLADSLVQQFKCWISQGSLNN